VYRTQRPRFTLRPKNMTCGPSMPGLQRSEMHGSRTTASPNAEARLIYTGRRRRVARVLLAFAAEQSGYEMMKEYIMRTGDGSEPTRIRIAERPTSTKRVYARDCITSNSPYISSRGVGLQRLPLAFNGVYNNTDSSRTVSRDRFL